MSSSTARREAKNTVITYSLQAGQACSCSYYEQIGPFADEVIAEGEKTLSALLDEYQTRLSTLISSTPRDTPRTRPEYLLDLLTLGLLWRTYGNHAWALSSGPGAILTQIAVLRERHARWKKTLDVLRGALQGPLYISSSSRPNLKAIATLKDLERLLRWMAAAGRFVQESERLKAWQGLFTVQAPEVFKQEMAALSGYTAWFEERSLAALGPFTPNVDHFRAEVQPGYRWREDYIFCGRRRAEYHLNMLGVEMINRALRESFLRTPRKVVLIPPCIRALPDDECKAQHTPYGDRCTACTPTCRAHQLTKLGEKYGFAVFTLPDDLRVFSLAAKEGSDPAEKEQTGIVGVSCVLTNAPGGWQVRDLGLPAQGVPLDYCGCSYHWHKTGISTSVDFHQVLRILGIVD